eukprot:351987-Chlamydomonas_euryale.AAC.7
MSGSLYARWNLQSSCTGGICPVSADESSVARPCSALCVPGHKQSASLSPTNAKSASNAVMFYVGGATTEHQKAHQRTEHCCRRCRSRRDARHLRSLGPAAGDRIDMVI